MEDTLTIAQNQPDAAPVGKKTKFFRIAAFSSYVLGIVWSWFIFWIVIINVEDIQTAYKYNDYFNAFISFLSWGFLALIAPNKPVRIATCLLAMLPILFVGLFQIVPINALNVHVSTLLLTVRDLIPIYLFSLIMMNASFTPKETGWINLLVIVYCVTIIWNITNQYLYSPAVNGGDFAYECAYTAGLYKSQRDVDIILYLIAFYKLCFSNALSGTYDKEAPARYTLRSKYLIGGVVAAAVTCGLLYLVFLLENEITYLL